MPGTLKVTTKTGKTLKITKKDPPKPPFPSKGRPKYV